MDDFLDYIQKRRAVLRKELEDLDAAERIYLASGATTLSGQHQLFYTPDHWPSTIKEMVIKLLSDTPNGLTSSQILDLIKARWKPSLQRASLSPQLTRLKNDKLIWNDRKLWKLVQEAFNESGASADTDAPEISGEAPSSSGRTPDLQSGEAGS